MLVVSDTSPLSNLAIIGRLDLLREQFSEVLMPMAVSRELAALTDSTARLALGRAMTDGPVSKGGMAEEASKVFS